MKVYVAGKFTEKARVQEVMLRLVAAGHEITHDWTVVPEPSPELSEKERKIYYQECANADLFGIFEADAFVWIYHPDSRGAFVEYGYARASGLPTFIMGPADLIKDKVFESLADRGLDEHDVLLWLDEVSKYAF